jgi:hypothetical protein
VPQPLDCPRPRWVSFVPGAALFFARDLGWCDHDYPRWGGHNTTPRCVAKLPVLGEPASILGSELSRYGAPTLLLPHRFWGCLWSMDWTLPGLGKCQLHRVFQWGRFSKNPLPRPNRLRMLPVSGAVLAHNTRGDMSILRAPAELVLSRRGFRVPAFSCTATGEERHFCCTLDRCGLGPASRTVSPRSGKDPSPLRSFPRLIFGRAAPLQLTSGVRPSLCPGPVLQCLSYVDAEHANFVHKEPPI